MKSKKNNGLVIFLILVLSAIFLPNCHIDNHAEECTGNSCNGRRACPPGQALTTLYLDMDNDGFPERYSGNGVTMSVCMAPGTEAPENWTFNSSPWDNCPNYYDDTNQCGIDYPIITISAVVDGRTVTINADPRYANGIITRVDFYSGAIFLGSDSTANPWQNIWTNVPDGTYTLHATAYTNDGKVAYSNNVTVTINSGAICVPQFRCSYSLEEGTRFHGLSISCLNSINGQDPAWQWMPFQTCGGPGNVCTFTGNLWVLSLNAGGCEFNGAAPSGLNGNPIPSSFTSQGGYGTDWILTQYLSGTTLQTNNEMVPNSLHCEVNTNCTDWVSVQTGYTVHTWGMNYWAGFTDIIDGNTDDQINMWLGFWLDSDGDGWFNGCPPNTNCIPDNCIRYDNVDQSINPCLTHPNPLLRDSDNDGHFDGEDDYPNDPTRY